jgi:hypothetical protein
VSLYYFLIEDGTFEHLPERLDLPNLDAARLHAANLSQTLIAEGRGRFARGEAWQMRVTDEGGFTCFSLQFTAVLTPMGGRNSYRAMAAERLCEAILGDEIAPLARQQ